MQNRNKMNSELSDNTDSSDESLYEEEVEDDGCKTMILVTKKDVSVVF